MVKIHVHPKGNRRFPDRDRRFDNCRFLCRFHRDIGFCLCFPTADFQGISVLFPTDGDPAVTALQCHYASIISYPEFWGINFDPNSVIRILQTPCQDVKCMCYLWHHTVRRNMQSFGISTDTWFFRNMIPFRIDTFPGKIGKAVKQRFIGMIWASAFNFQFRRHLAVYTKYRKIIFPMHRHKHRASSDRTTILKKYCIPFSIRRINNSPLCNTLVQISHVICQYIFSGKLPGKWIWHKARLAPHRWPMNIEHIIFSVNFINMRALISQTNFIRIFEDHTMKTSRLGCTQIFF